MAQGDSLPPIPAKRYFTIGEVSALCCVKPHVLRYWENEFTQLRPVKRGGNRRYYRHHEVLMVRRICHLLYEQGFTIHGARDQLEVAARQQAQNKPNAQQALPGLSSFADEALPALAALDANPPPALSEQQAQWLVAQLREIYTRLTS